MTTAGGERGHLLNSFHRVACLSHYVYIPGLNQDAPQVLKGERVVGYHYHLDAWQRTFLL